MEKAKTILFIGNNYCCSIEELHSIFESNNKSNYVGKEGKPLRKELLAYFKDDLLSIWLVDHGYDNIAEQLPTWKTSDDISDSELFKAIYKAIFGKECTADLESAFSSIAELVYCEVDGDRITIQNNKIVLPENANEIKFVYKALEEIDSKVCFKLTKLNSKPKIWIIDNKSALCSKGSEFSISFSFHTMGKNREGLYEWYFNSDHKERLYEMEIYGSQRQITLSNWEKMTLYRFNDDKQEFWITEPVYTNTKTPFNKSVLMLEDLNAKSISHRFRWATRQEIKTVMEQGFNMFDKVLPAYSKDQDVYCPFFDGRFVRFISKGLKTNDNMKSFCFVAVLDGNFK